MVHKPTARTLTSLQLFLHSPRGTCTSAWSDRSRVSPPRRVSRSGSAATPPPRRGSIASTRRSGPPRRRGRAPPRHPPRAARRRPRLPAAARRREGLRTRWERATRREDAVRAFPPPRRRRVVPETWRREPPRTTPPWTRACDRRARMSRRTRWTRRGGSSLAPAARGGVAPVGAGAWSSRAVLPLSRSVRRESMQRRRRGGDGLPLEGGGTDEGPLRGALTSRGRVRWVRFARVRR